MTIELASREPLFRFHRVRHYDEAASSCVKVTLFRGFDRRIRAWYIGPMSWSEAGGLVMPYLSPKDSIFALVAILRATNAARAARVEVCIVDPDNLWASIWTN